jgi:arylsulfatase A-like enzyme
MNPYRLVASSSSFIRFISIVIIFLLLGCTSIQEKRIKPNIILFLIDDLGYGDLGCYGNKEIFTPNIDRLAEQGMRFTDFHSNGPMCTPTRAALLTGKYQNRFGEKFEGPLSGKTQYNEGLPLEAVTIAEKLKEAGYATGMFGKWHLGYKPPYLPTNQGFDEFVGLAAGDEDHHSHIDRWGREDWWKNEEKKMEDGYSVELITDHSKSFIERHQDQPFFLYIAHLAIHFPWQGPDDPAHRRAGTTYENDKWGIIPDRENVQPHVKAMLESIDDGVGEIVRLLDELEIDENTLLIFTSDNGGYIHYNQQFHNISSNGPLRGQKAEVYEGGHRVPMIARWPGKIGIGQASNETTMTFDLFPTFMQLAGIPGRSDQQLDGIDLSAHLIDQQNLPHRTLFWKMDDEIAVREGQWKLVKLGDQEAELYDLDNDLSETHDCASINQELLEELWTKYLDWEKQLNKYRENHIH